MDNKPIFDVVRALLKAHNPSWTTFTPVEIAQLDAAIAKVVKPVVEAKFEFSERSLKNLSEVHPHLQAVINLALVKSDTDFLVYEGGRTLAEQKKLVAEGASQTMNSRHLTGHAVDVVPLIEGEVRWDWPLYRKLAVAIKAASKELNIPIEWGGDWRRFKDGPHWQLPFKEYPK